MSDGFDAERFSQNVEKEAERIKNKRKVRRLTVRPTRKLKLKRSS